MACGSELLGFFLAVMAVISMYGLRRREQRDVEPESVVLQVEEPIWQIGRQPYSDIGQPVLPTNVYADNWDLDPDMPMALAKVMWAIREVESGGDPNRVGDKHLRHKAYGVLQIRQPYLDDAMKIAGSEAVSERWGVDRLTISDMRDASKAWWVAEVYLKHYGEQYRKKTGREPTSEIFARIHNGGPNGWRKSSTNDYIRKVMQALEDDR